MSTSLLAAIGAVLVLLLVALGWRYIVLERHIVHIDHKLVALRREGDDPIWRGLIEDAADLARLGTPEALAAREQINHVIRRMQTAWDRSERDGRRNRDPHFLRELMAAMDARDRVLATPAARPSDSMSGSDPGRVGPKPPSSTDSASTSDAADRHQAHLDSPRA